MSERDDIIKRLDGILGNTSKFWSDNPTKRSAVHDYYEVYVWALAIDEVKKSNGSVTYTNAGPNSDHFIFRKSPGNIYSPNLYTHAEIRRPSCRTFVELHIGIAVMGMSGVSHEFDVVGLDGHSAEIARLQKCDPDFLDVILHAECKFHTSDLSLGIARGILGLAVDCPSIAPLLISKGTASNSVDDLITYYGGSYAPNVMPTKSGEVFARARLISQLRRGRRRRLRWVFRGP